MTTPMRNILIVCSMLAGLTPVYLAMAQEERSERLDGLFVPDSDDVQSREERREQFAHEHPGMAARMEQRRAEMEARRAGFEAKYPEAAAELKTWREQERANREQDRVQRQDRRKQFEQKYPEAAAEMKSWREQEQSKREQQRAAMKDRMTQFAEKYPEAAAEMKSWRKDGRRPQGEFRRHRMHSLRNGGQ